MVDLLAALQQALLNEKKRRDSHGLVNAPSGWGAACSCGALFNTNMRRSALNAHADHAVRSRAISRKAGEQS